MKWIDLHGHYSWGIDDGAINQEATYQMLKQAQSSGCETIVATPHLTCGCSEEQLLQTLARIKEVAELGAKMGIEVKRGAEWKLNEHLEEQMQWLPIEDTNYLLCEYDLARPFEDFLRYFDSHLFEIIQRGYRPIVAHIERYFHEDIDLSYVESLLAMGCVIAVNTTSVLYSGKFHDNALALLDAQLVHVLTSDAHSFEGARNVNMAQAIHTLQKKGFAKSYLEALCYTHPKAILQNQALELDAYPTHRLRRWLHR